MIILARNTHAGREQAEHLEDLIKRADVVSFETANLSRPLAQELEDNFSAKIEHFLRVLQEDNDNPAYDYEAALYELIIRWKKPVVFAESISFKDLPDIISSCRLWKMTDENSKKAFCSGQFDQAVKLRINSAGYLLNNSQARNKAILDYSPKALNKAREKAGKDCTYLIILGAKHNIAEGLAQKTGVEIEDIFIPSTSYAHLHPRHEVWRYLNERAENTPLGRLAVAREMATAFLESLVDSSMMLFAQEVIPPALQRFPYSVIICLNIYTAKPIAANLARQLEEPQLRQYSRQLARKNCSLNNMDKIRDVSHEFLRTQGFGLPRSDDESQNWNQFFPFGQEQSTEPVITVYDGKGEHG